MGQSGNVFGALAFQDFEDYHVDNGASGQGLKESNGDKIGGAGAYLADPYPNANADGCENGIDDDVGSV